MLNRHCLKLLVAVSMLTSSALMWAEMTDREVLDYLVTAASQGKTQQQIGKELVVRGVNQAQLVRVKKLYEKTYPNGVNPDKAASTTSKNTTVRRSQEHRSTTTQAATGATNRTAQAPAAANRGGIAAVNGAATGSRPATGATRIVVADENRQPGQEENEYYLYDEAGNPVLVYEVEEKPVATVYGQNVFNNPNLTFEPNINAATPENYRLGPGDEVVINIWGNNEDYIRDYISPEGTIIVSNIGPVSLSGMTVKQANDYLKNIFAQKYADIADEGSDISLVLGDMRTIQVDIMGEVNSPGTYRLSPFSTLFHALYNAGGTSEGGTLRDIAIFRNGRQIATADVYDYLFKGQTSNDIKLQEGDVILVRPYQSHVTFESGVKRPMTYELKNGETVADAINYAGGFDGEAFTQRVNIIRTTGDGLNVLTVESPMYASTQLLDGDIIEIGNAINRFDNRIEVSGAVMRPGAYALGREIKTLSDLIAKAGGLLEDAFLGRAQLFRQADDLSQEVMAVDLAGIMAGRTPDIVLRPNDMLVVSSLLDLSPKGDVVISGAVNTPGNYPYAAGTTVEDLILQAGGLLEGASEAKVDISRRIYEENATGIQSKIADNYTITLKNGLVVDGQAGFELMPNDVVDVRFSPVFVAQRRVSIEGEVPFAGSYTLGNRTERLSDLVKRAGGVSEFAYLKGAHLTRTYTKEELAAMEETRRLSLSKMSQDSIDESILMITETYPVGINLEEALKQPGGAADLVLQEGDVLYIPELVNTVKISGEVLYPNSVIFTPGKKLSFYINQAGGYAYDANKGGAFVVYMNGQVAKGKNAKIEPGCQIIVPTKEKKDTTGNLQKWLAIGSSAAALGTMAASIVNLIK